MSGSLFSDNGFFQLDPITEGNCRAWGNPLTEIYRETLRYLAGETAPTLVFATRDTALFPTLPTVTWHDPIVAADPACVA